MAKATTKKKEACVHHFDIDGDNRGVCRKCGKVRVYPKWGDPKLVDRRVKVEDLDVS